jgi:hypothetical protein
MENKLNSGVNMINGIIGTHLATGQEVELPLNGKEMQLALDKGAQLNESWTLMNRMVRARGEISIIGEVEVDFLVVNGVKRSFH